MSTEIEIERAPPSFKSDVWRHFGFKKGDKQKVVCLHCKTALKYSGNTTNMASHKKRYHQDENPAPQPGPKKLKQTTLGESVKLKFSSTSDKSQHITRGITELLVDGLLPYSFVEGKKFRSLIHTLEPRYVMPNRHFFADECVPKMYNELKEVILTEIMESERVAITTDSWTSRATQSYLTITAHFLSRRWELKNYVLQTRILEGSHTGVNIAHALLDAGKEWGYAAKDPVLVSDNASNMTVAGKECGYSKHIGCFAHTLNLAAQKSLASPQVSRLLGKIKHVVQFFHKSSSALCVLKEKQALLGIPNHKLINDVPTRWNSSYDMVERFLEQQPALIATLMSKEVRKCEKDIASIKEEDISVAEDFCALMKPVKMATTVLCSEQLPTASLIFPLQRQLLNAMEVRDSDKPIIKDMKRIFTADLSQRYKNQSDYLCMVSALDPRFKSLPMATDEMRAETYLKLREETSLKVQKVSIKTEAGARDQPAATTSTSTQGSSDPPPPLPTAPALQSDDID